VLAGVMGTEGMEKPAPFSNPKLYNDYYTYNFHVPSNIVKVLKLNKANLSESIIPVAGSSLTFKTVDEGVVLKPLYSIHQQRYVVYWNLK